MTHSVWPRACVARAASTRGAMQVSPARMRAPVPRPPRQTTTSCPSACDVRAALPLQRGPDARGRLLERRRRRVLLGPREVEVADAPDGHDVQVHVAHLEAHDDQAHLLGLELLLERAAEGLADGEEVVAQ